MKRRLVILRKWVRENEKTTVNILTSITVLGIIDISLLILGLILE